MNQKLSEGEFTLHYFNFTPKNNGGEQLILTTQQYFNPNGESCLRQELTLGSYGNTSTFSLEGTPFNPTSLRSLADQLEKVLFSKCHA